MRILLTLLSILAVPAAEAGSQGQSSTVIGVNPALSDGARALQFGQYSEGVRLTLSGLKSETSKRQRATALSNLCAGYVGLQDYAAALEACNDALAIRPQFWRALNNRGLAYLGQRQFGAARDDIEQGLAINPASQTLQKSLRLLERRVSEVRLAKTAT